MRRIDEEKDVVKYLNKLICDGEDLTTLASMLKQDYLDTNDSPKQDELLKEIQKVYEDIYQTKTKVIRILQ